MAEHKVFSACPHDCPDTCAMITTVRDGKAIDVRGNPDHPFTRGGLCVKVNDYQNRVYSPDRVLYPLKRTVEITVAVSIIEILALATAKANVVTDCFEDPHHLLVEMATMYCVMIMFT
jgi:predicted molibdopterin-dependent oxidoreductase YjgC